MLKKVHYLLLLTLFSPFSAFANTLKNDADMLKNTFSYNEAFTLYNEVIANKKSNKNDLIESYIGISEIYNATENYNNALKYTSFAIQKLQMPLDENQKNTFLSRILLQQAISYNKKNVYNKALQAAQNALTFQNDSDPKNLLLHLTILNQIGLSHLMKGDLANSLKTYTSILNLMAQETTIQHHNIVIDIYSNVGTLYEKSSLFNEALVYKRKAFQVANSHLGTTHNISKNILLDIALLYDKIGDYSTAKQIKQEQILSSDKVKIDIFSKADLLTSLGYSCDRLSQYDDALIWKNKSKQILQKYRTKASNERLRTTYAELGHTYFYQKDFHKALTFQEKALAMCIKELGYNSDQTATVLSQLSFTYLKLKQFDKAQSIQNKAINSYLSTAGKYHFYTANAYNTLSLIFLEQSQLQKALHFALLSQEIYQKNSMEHHLYSINNLMTLSQIYLKFNMIEKAYFYAHLSATKSNDFLRNQFQYLSQEEKYLIKRTFLNIHNNFYKIAYTYQETHSDQETSIFQNIIELSLNSKGVISEYDSLLHHMRQRTSQDNQQVIDELHSKKLALSRLLNNTHLNGVRLNSKIELTKNEIATLEKKISSEVSKFKTLSGLSHLTLNDLNGAIDDHVLVLDIIKVEDKYLFVTYMKNDISTLNLLDEQQITNLTKNFHGSIKNTIDYIQSFNEYPPKYNLEKESLTKLYHLIFQNLTPQQMKTIRKIIISPDGQLNQFPFEVIINNDTGKHLIEEKSVKYAPSLRDIVTLHKYGENTHSHNTVLFTRPMFNIDTTDTNLTENSKFEGNLRSLKGLKGVQFTDLHHSEEEKKAIDAYDGRSLIFEKERASEENLLQLKSPSVLHLNTHGFYLDSDDISPLQKSGIVLSGANKSIEKGEDHGIITALKISGIDLSGTKLVVLSACQTALGNIELSEGIMGLNKAFIIAGAQNTITTLWSVDDAKTSLFMRYFYENLTHHSPEESLQMAKLTMIQNGYHPFFWAPFIINGK